MSRREDRGGVTTEALERSVLSLIREEIERAAQPDTAAIAHRVLAELEPDELRHYAERGLRDYVTNCLSQVRHPAGNGNGSSGSARWDVVKSDIASGELDLARYSVYTGVSRKWLLDCNTADLHGASDWHRDRGDRYHALADAMSGLEQTLKSKQGAEVVGDLPEQKVKGLLANA
jgi:hypothetical protein